jgi:hypothetical protein
VTLLTCFACCAVSIYMSSVSITVGGDSFACVPSLVCRGRVTLLTSFACCAVSVCMMQASSGSGPELSDSYDLHVIISELLH